MGQVNQRSFFYESKLFANIIFIVTFDFSIIACVLAYIIPKRIMFNQLYTDLIAEYRSHEIGLAIISIVDFFRNDCGLQITKIGEKYFERYENEFNKENSLAKNKTLHFKRRLLAQWYWQLEHCVTKHRIPLFKVDKKQLKNDFPNNEANLLKIIYYMNKEIDNNKEIYKNIEVNEVISYEKNESLMNQHIYSLYRRFEKR